jgi:dynein heavy chain
MLLQMPGPDIVRSIYHQLINGHLQDFDPEVAKLSMKLTDATIDLHKNVMNTFLPSSIKFHYQFNLREMSNITQGFLRMTKDRFKSSLKVARMWVHECERVFRDRLVNASDLERFDDMLTAAVKTHFKEEPFDQLMAKPNLFTAFMDYTSDETPVYSQVPGYEQLKKTLEDRLAEYNESNAVMSLVLFQQAMEHVCRIARIIDLPRGNAMLVGVGGSGKQSLARLASFINKYDVFQIAVSGTYGVNDFKENLLQLYTKAGMKGQPVTFLLTDNQIVNERFLVFLNDLLSTGLVSDLCATEDVENFTNAVRNEAKAAGVIDTHENLWDFFIEKIRRRAPLLFSWN